MIKLKLLSILLCLWALTGCYYDVESELYPTSGGCDTLDVSLSIDLKEVFTRNNCIGCHNSNLQNGSVNLETYAGVLATAETGKLVSSITHDGKASAMPPGGVKISTCDVQKVLAWIQQGKKNN